MATFDLVKVLGKGSFSKVFLAKPKSTFKDESDHLEYYAIKRAPIHRSSTLLNEECILKRFIGCPEIVQCLGNEITIKSNSTEFIYNLKLEYAAGGTLADLIRRKKKLPENEAKEYLKMILRGLCEIHGKGFVHADLKPHNILAFPQSDDKIMKLKIADFGLSMRCGEKNEDDDLDLFKFKGTPTYMSPESVTFPEFNTALDIWSLGCTLVKMVSGKSVWKHCEDRTQLITKLVLDMEVPKIPRELSREGKDFIRRCFDHDPTQRWTAHMLLQHPYFQEVSMPMRIMYLAHELFENQSNYKRKPKQNYKRKPKLQNKELYISQIQYK